MFEDVCGVGVVCIVVVIVGSDYDAIVVDCNVLFESVFCCVVICKEFLNFCLRVVDLVLEDECGVGVVFDSDFLMSFDDGMVIVHGDV